MKYLILILSLIMLTGCQDLKDLYNLTFPAAMAIDYNNNEYTVTFQIINPNSLSKAEIESSINKGEILITSSTASSINEAIQQLENKMRIEIKVDHVDSILITANTLNTNILQEILNFTLCTQNIRLATSLFVADDDIENLFQVKHNISNSPYFSLIAYNSIKKLSTLESPTNLLEIMKSTKDPRQVSILPHLNVDENSIIISEFEETYTKQFNIDKISLLSGQTIHTFDKNEVLGLNYIHPKKNYDVSESITYQDKIISYSILSNKYKTNFKNNKFNINIDLTIALESCPPELTEEQNLQLISENIKEKVLSTYLKLLDNNIDYLNLNSLDSTPLTAKNISVNINSRLELKKNIIEHGGLK